MAYVITVKIPVELYEKHGLDRDEFLKAIEKNVSKCIKQKDVEVTIQRGE